MRCLLVSCAVLLCSISNGQGHPFGAIRTIEKTRLFPGAVAAADFDLDGRVDLATANALSLDIGNGPATVSLLSADFKIRRKENLDRTKEIGLVAYPAIAAADFDADGLSDVLVISDHGNVIIYLNEGPGLGTRKGFRQATAPHRLTFMKRQNPSFVRVRVTGLSIDDYNEDGKLDVALTAEGLFFNEIIVSTGIVILEGDGKGGFQRERLLRPGNFIALVAADMDGNGHVDLLGLARDRSMAMVRNMGKGKYEVDIFQIPGPVKAHALAAGDLNGDGRADLIVAGRPQSAAVVAYLSDMRGMPDRQFKIAIPEMSLSRIESMQLEDMDGDNKKDLMLLMSSFVKRTEFQFLKGKGALRFAPAVRIALETSLNPKDSSGMNSLMRIVDFNLDRNPDVLIGSVQHSQSKSFVQFVLPNRLANRFGVRLHGKAVAGSGAVIPKITRVGGHSDIGNKYFGISLSYVPGDKTQVVLMMSARLTPITTPWFTIQVFPIFSFGAETKGTGVGEGHVVLPFPIPKFKDLLGKTYYFQWLIADPGAKNPAGLSMTQALATTLTQN